MLSAPAPNATIWSSPPAIITFLRKWIIWFWSAGSGDFDGRGAVARAMSLPSAARSRARARAMSLPSVAQPYSGSSVASRSRTICLGGLSRPKTRQQIPTQLATGPGAH